MTAAASIWTPARVAELTELFADGLSYEDIGQRMGLTKNAVLGKAHRLGFEVRVEIAPQSTTLSRLDALNIFPPGSRCQFPIGNPGSDGFHFCGTKTIESADPYCREHHKVAFTRSTGSIEQRSAAWTDERKAEARKRLLARAGG